MVDNQQSHRFVQQYEESRVSGVYFKVNNKLGKYVKTQMKVCPAGMRFSRQSGTCGALSGEQRLSFKLRGMHTARTKQSIGDFNGSGMLKILKKRNKTLVKRKTLVAAQYNKGL